MILNSNQPEDTKSTELQTVSAKGSPAPRRLATPAAAAAIFSALKTEDYHGEAKRRAIIQGMVDGNPPYRQAELDEMGLGNIINVNFMTMRANLDARASAGHELFVEVPNLIECKALAVTQNNPEVHHFCSILAEEFTDLLHNWDGFLPAMDLVWRDSDAYGVGFGVFENEWDWRIKAFRRGNLLIDAKASVEVDKNDFVMVRDEMSASEMFQLLQDEELARERGWNPKYMKELLVSVFIGGEKDNAEHGYQVSAWEAIQQMARNNDSDFQQKQFEHVRIVHIYVKEVAGDQKISHYIIPEMANHDFFIYEGLDQYDKMSNVVWWLPYNYGDGYLRSIRGVASYMVQHDDLSNRFLCRVFDAGFMSSSLLLQPRTQMDLSKMQLMQYGVTTLVPPEASVVQSSFQPQIGQALQLRSVSEQVMKNNTGTYRQHNEAVGDNEVMKTARQVMEESSKEARFEKAAIASRYTHLDKLYREIFRRVCSEEVLTSTDIVYPGGEEAQAFFKRCVDRGVPKEFIFDWKNKFRVSAYRSIGLGSLGAKYDITNQMLNVSGSLDEVGKRNVLRDWVAVRVGYGNSDKYVTTIDRDQITSNETSIAMLEFNDVEEGSQVVVGHDQLHKIHIMVFAERLAPIMQAAEQGQTQDPISAFQTMQLATQHIQQHLQILAQDPRHKDFVAEVVQFLQAAARVTQLLEQEAKRLIKAQQQQQAEQQEMVNNAQQIQQDRALEAKIYEINQKTKVDMIAQESLNNMRLAKTETQNAIADKRASADIKRRAEKQAVDLQLEVNKANAEIELKRARQQG